MDTATISAIIKVGCSIMGLLHFGVALFACRGSLDKAQWYASAACLFILGH